MSKIVKNIALGLMVSALAPSSQAADCFLRAQPGFGGANVTKADAEVILANTDLVKLHAQKAEVDVSKPEEIREFVTAIQNARPQDNPTEIYDNATVLGPIVGTNYGGVATKEDFYLLAEPDQIRLKQEAKVARSLQLDLRDADTLQTFQEMTANPQLADKKSDPVLVKLAFEERKQGHALDHAVLFPRAELSKLGCRDNSAEALASLGHIDADDLTNVKFVDGQAGYVGGAKNLNIETLAALAKMGIADPTEAQFCMVRDVVDAVNKVNDSKTIPPVFVTGDLADIALHLAPQRAGLGDKKFFKLVLAYNYLINGLGIAGADLDANPAILVALKQSSKKLEALNLINGKAANYFDIADRNIAAAALQLQLTPELARRANAGDVTLEDLQVVAELFRTVGAIHIGRLAGIGFNQADVDLFRKVMVDFNKKPADFNNHHVAAVAEHTDEADPLHIANVSWEQIDASAALRAAHLPLTVANVNASLYLAGLEDADGLGINPVDADQIAAVIAMQDAAFAGGAIAKPSEAEVMQYEALRAGGIIALNKANVQASVYLSELHDADGLGIDPVDADQIAAVIAMEDAAFPGGAIENPTCRAVIEAVRMTAAAIPLSKDNVVASVVLQYGPEGGAQIIADPDQGDIEACLEIARDARNLNIAPLAGKAVVIAAVKHLKTIPALTNTYTVPDLKITAKLQMQLPANKNAGVLGPVGFNPSEAQIAAVVGTPDEAQTLVSWKMQKEEEAGHNAFIPGAVLRFVSDDDGTADHHAEFEVVHVLRGAGLTATPGRIVDHKIKVDPAILAGLTDGRGGHAAPNIGQLFVVSNLRDDGGDAARVTLRNPDRMPS